ncbi:hypothetical protein FB008_104248 [Sinorhizobium medicae]|nr:hypothetical protein FB007_107156 [Sinorhizobium medicae]TWA54156.1 hypothetical protein FB008_104248 [Sinorhizobium medicae]
MYDGTLLFRPLLDKSMASSRFGISLITCRKDRR